MLSLHLHDLPKHLQDELEDWILANFKSAKSWYNSNNYNLKQHFKFSEAAEYHITTTIFHEAMVDLGFESKKISEDRYVYKIRRI